ncbi:hypothetical protein JCM10213v2_000803 [Rhodosporidiobolus nylandii]
MAGVFTEPTYVLAEPPNAILSEARPTRLSPTALLALNYLLDELLHIVCHAALHSPAASASPAGSPPLSGGPAPPAPSPLAPGEVLTTDRFKAALARILGPTSLTKECILEAELAVRELLRRGSPSLRGDGALKKSAMWGTPVLPSLGEEGGEEGAMKAEVAKQANGEVFRALRAWVMQLSGLGAESEHLTFLLALYVERVLTCLATHILRRLGDVAARTSSPDAAVSDLETAMMEDDLVWSWAQGMRVRRFIADEAQKEREKSRGPPPPARLSNAATATRTHRKNYSVSTSSISASSPLSSASGLSRKASLNGSTLTPSASSSSRKASIDSVRTAATGLTYSASRKGSFGLGILGASRSNGSESTLDGDTFDQLLSSSRTIKLSSTPDRLRTFEDPSSSGVTGSASMPTLPSAFSAPSASGMTKSSSGRRLQARDPTRQDLLEEDEDLDDADPGARPKRRKETLQDILSSPPPWATSEPPPPLPPSPSLSSIAASGRPVAMRVQNSQNSVTTVGSGLSDEKSGEAKSSSRARALKAKDERRDVATERQVNTDLMDFFNSAPPGPPLAGAYDSDLPSPLSPKKSKGGIRGLMSKVTGGGGKRDEDQSSATCSHSSAPVVRKLGSGRSQSISGTSIATSSSSVTAAQGAGFSPATSKPAAYVPPPGLGASPAQPLREAIANSSPSASRARGERLPSRSPPPASLPSQPEQPPRSILVKPNGETALPPPVPSDVLPPSTASNNSLNRQPIRIPSRSSSLKRRPRHREHSAASSASGAIAIPPSQPASRVHQREPSANSTSATSIAARQLPSLETSSPPVVVRPNGLVQPDFESKSSIDTLDQESFASHGTSRKQSMEEQPAASLLPAAPIASASTDSPPPPQPPVQPASAQAEAEAAVDETPRPRRSPAPSPTVERTPPILPTDEPVTLPRTVRIRPAGTTPHYGLPTSPRVACFSNPSPSRTPPPAPRVTRFSAPSPSLTSSTSPSRSSPSRPTPRPSSPLASPPLASPPLASPPLLSVDGKSLVGVLKELRGAMLYAQTRDECVQLVEALLRDQARRAEASAALEGRDSQTALRGLGMSPSVSRDELARKDSRTTEVAGMAEFFLAGGDLAPFPTSASPPAAEGTCTPVEKAQLPAAESITANPTTAQPDDGAPTREDGADKLGSPVSPDVADPQTLTQPSTAVPLATPELSTSPPSPQAAPVQA